MDIIPPYILYNEPVCNEITNKIHKLKNIPVNSQSKSIYYIINFRPDEIQSTQGKETIKNAFLKFSLASSIRDDKLTNIDELKMNLKGMEYEIDLYRIIKQAIIYTGICDSFVDMIAYSKNCTKEEMANAFSTIDNINISEEDRIKYLSYLTRCLSTGRPIEIFSDDFIYRNDAYLKQLVENQRDTGNVEYRYCYLITESMGGNMTLHQIFSQDNNAFINYNTRTNNIDFTIEFYNLLFQIVYACNILDIFGISHNDMHSGNVWVKTHALPFSRSYTINNTEYIINSRYEILIYDFDRGYMKQLGDNETITFLRADSYSQNNSFVKGKNLFKIFTNIFHICKYLFNSNQVNQRILWINTNVFTDFFSLIVKNDILYSDKISNEVYSMFKGDNEQGYLYLRTYNNVRDVYIPASNKFYTRNMLNFDQIIDKIYNRIPQVNISVNDIVKRFLLPSEEQVNIQLQSIEEIIGKRERILGQEPEVYESFRSAKVLFIQAKNELEVVREQNIINETSIENTRKLITTYKENTNRIVQTFKNVKEKLKLHMSRTYRYSDINSMDLKLLLDQKTNILRLMDSLQYINKHEIEIIDNHLNRESIINPKSSVEDLEIRITKNSELIKELIKNVYINSNVILIQSIKDALETNLEQIRTINLLKEQISGEIIDIKEEATKLVNLYNSLPDTYMKRIIEIENVIVYNNILSNQVSKYKNTNNTISIIRSALENNTKSIFIINDSIDLIAINELETYFKTLEINSLDFEVLFEQGKTILDKSSKLLLLKDLYKINFKQNERDELRKETNNMSERIESMLSDIENDRKELENMETENELINKGKNKQLKFLVYYTRILTEFKDSINGQNLMLDQILDTIIEVVERYNICYQMYESKYNDLYKKITGIIQNDTESFVKTYYNELEKIPIEGEIYMKYPENTLNVQHYNQIVELYRKLDVMLAQIPAAIEFINYCINKANRIKEIYKMNEKYIDMFIGQTLGIRNKLNEYSQQFIYESIKYRNKADMIMLK